MFVATDCIATAALCYTLVVMSLPAPRDDIMVASTDRTMSKTAFVTTFLGENPTANPKAVNEAWAKEGRSGSISPTLVTNLRSKLGLAGNLRASSKVAEAKGLSEGSKAGGTVARMKNAAKTEAKARSRTSTLAAGKFQSQGKSAFIKEVLFDNPRANAEAVNVAWKRAGMNGTISASLVNTLRAELGLTGNLRARSKSAAGEVVAKTATAKNAGRPTKAFSKTGGETRFNGELHAAGAPQRKFKPSDRDRVLTEIECDLDRVIHTLDEVEGMSAIVDAVRTVRRQVIRSHEA